MVRVRDPNLPIFRREKVRRLKEGKSRFIYAQNTSASSKLPILAPVIDLADTELSEGGGAHTTWFDGHVEDCISEKVWIPRDSVVLWSKEFVRENLVDCF